MRIDILVAHDCGYPLSRYTCRATRVAADFLDFTAFCRCSSGVAPHPLKVLVSHLPPPFPGGVAPKFGSEKVSRYTGVSQVQLRVSRIHCATKIDMFENAPTCYRAPRWPDPEFPRKIPKKYPRAEILEPQENTPKIPKKYQNAHFLIFLGYFFGIFGVFWGEILGVQNFGPGGIFSVFFVEIPGRAISGLCSRSGRSQRYVEIIDVPSSPEPTCTMITPGRVTPRGLLQRVRVHLLCEREGDESRERGQGPTLSCKLMGILFETPTPTYKAKI